MKKIISIIAVMALLCTLIPMTAMAEISASRTYAERRDPGTYGGANTMPNTWVEEGVYTGMTTSGFGSTVDPRWLLSDFLVDQRVEFTHQFLCPEANKNEFKYTVRFNDGSGYYHTVFTSYTAGNTEGTANITFKAVKNNVKWGEWNTLSLIIDYEKSNKDNPSTWIMYLNNEEIDSGTFYVGKKNDDYIN